MRLALGVMALLGLSGVAGQEGRRVATDYPKDGVLWARTWNEAMREAANRNVPILVVFHQDGSEGCDAMAAIYRDRKFIEYSRTWVNVVAHPGNSHDVDIEIGGKKAPRCERYFQVSCREHADLHAHLSRQFKVESAVPQRVFYDALNVKELGRDTGATKLAELIKSMDKIQALIEGEKVSLDEWHKAAELLAEGDEGFKKKEWQKAIKAYRGIIKLGKESLNGAASIGLNKINAEGEKLHTKAYESQPKDLKGEFTVTKRILREIIEKFKTLPVADKALEYLRGLESHGH